MATIDKGKKQVTSGQLINKSKSTHVERSEIVQTSKGTLDQALPKFTSQEIVFVSFRNKAKESRATDLDIINSIQAGLPAKVVQEAAQWLELPTTTVELIIPRRTLERRLKADKPLSIEESDKLVRLIQTIARAMEVFGDQETALRWMKAPNRAMGGRTPFSVVNTSPGVELIKDILGRIEHGVYS